MFANIKTYLVAGVMVFSVVNSQAEERAGTVKSLTGTVTVERSGVSTPIQIGDAIYSTDKIRTGTDSSVGIVMRDESLLSTGARSTLIIQKFSYDNKTTEGALDAKITRGSLSVVSGKLSKRSPEAVRFSTPTTVFGVRGTEFIVNVEGDQDE